MIGHALEKFPDPICNGKGKVKENIRKLGIIDDSKNEKTYVVKSEKGKSLHTLYVKRLHGMEQNRPSGHLDLSFDIHWAKSHFLKFYVSHCNSNK
jgi:hypothetical protein